MSIIVLESARLTPSGRPVLGAQEVERFLYEGVSSRAALLVTLI